MSLLVQAEAPVDLLLGTDVQPQLGFMFMASSASGMSRELLKGGRWKTEESTSSETLEPNEPASAAVVRLLQATRVPAKFAKTVRTKIASATTLPSLFEPKQQFAEANDLRMHDAMVEPNDEQVVTLIIENHGLQPREGPCVGTRASSHRSWVRPIRGRYSPYGLSDRAQT